MKKVNGKTKMKRRIILFCTIALVAVMQLPYAAMACCVMPGVSHKMQDPSFWIHKLSKPSKIIMTNQQIAEFNRSNLPVEGAYLCDLEKYPDMIPKEKLIKQLNCFAFPTDDRYIGTEKVSNDFYQELKNNMNYQGVKAQNNVLYGVAVKRTNIRAYPTNTVSLEEPGDIEFDLMQESVLLTAEPVRIIHTSLDNLWYFIECKNCMGWVQSNDIAIAKDRPQWMSYINPSDFLIVTSNRLVLPYNPYSSEISELEMSMGVKIPFTPCPEKNIHIDNQLAAGNYVIYLPTRSASGELVIKEALLPTVSDVSIGYLPYTHENIIKQVFKAQGDRYGWGGMYNSRDCSALMLEVFRCFGIVTPRNTGAQEKMIGKTVEINTLSDIAARKKILDSTQPGSMLLMKNHVMMYLGKDNNKYYVMHSLYAYGDINKPKPSGGLDKIIVNSVVVSDLDIPIRRTGKSFLEHISMIKTVQMP